METAKTDCSNRIGEFADTLIDLCRAQRDWQHTLDTTHPRNKKEQAEYEKKLAQYARTGNDDYAKILKMFFCEYTKGPEVDE